MRQCHCILRLLVFFVYALVAIAWQCHCFNHIIYCVCRIIKMIVLLLCFIIVATLLLAGLLRCWVHGRPVSVAAKGGHPQANPLVRLYYKQHYKSASASLNCCIQCHDVGWANVSWYVFQGSSAASPHSKLERIVVLRWLSSTHPRHNLS